MPNMRTTNTISSKFGSNNQNQLYFSSVLLIINLMYNSHKSHEQLFFSLRFPIRIWSACRHMPHIHDETIVWKCSQIHLPPSCNKHTAKYSAFKCQFRKLMTKRTAGIAHTNEMRVVVVVVFISVSIWETTSSTSFNAALCDSLRS